MLLRMAGMEVKKEDLLRIAPMALRLRKSDFISKYFENQTS